MATFRKSDPPGVRSNYRSERLHEEGGQWFFATREGTLEGPFRDKFKALEVLDAYLAVAHLSLTEPDSELTILKEDK